MSFIHEHILTFITIAPLLAALIIMLTPKEKPFLLKSVSVFFSGISLVLSTYIFFTYDKLVGGYQFMENIPWVRGIGITYHTGVDGISLPMVWLTAIIMFCGSFASWTVQNRTKEFYALLLILVTGVFGVFVSLDLFFFFVFYELAVLPMYLLIGIWGTGRKEYSAMKLTLYLLLGSAFMLVGILALYFSSGLRTFDLVALSGVVFPLDFQKLFFFMFYIGFGILAAIWPLHTWSPDGHASAPTAVSMLHAGVLMKLGAYGVIRVALDLLPGGAKEWAFFVACIAVINVVYGSFVAMSQRDLKYVIAYSSVSHMGYVMLGIATLNIAGLNGAVMQMFSHGVMTGLFFALVGLVYGKSHNRIINEMGGFGSKMPIIAVFFSIAGLASLGLPGLSGFVAEFLIFVGTWQAYPWIAVAAMSAVVITAIYVLRTLKFIFWGPFNQERYHDLSDAIPVERVSLFILSFFLLLVGIYPSLLVDVIASGVMPLVEKIQLAGALTR